MKAIHIIAIISISFIAGMFGGAFSERVFANPNAEDKIPDQILARGFFLVDENKKPRAGMSFSKDGNPIIFVMDKEENVRGYLARSSDASIITLTDKKGGMNVALKAGDDGNSGIAIMKTSGQPRMMMQYEPGRGPGFALYDEKNVARTLMTARDGKAGIGLFHAHMKPAMALFYDSNRQASLLSFLNSNNEAKAGLGLMHDKPLLFAYNPDDTGLLFNTQRDGRPALGLLSEGRVAWSASGVTPEMPAMDGILDQILR